MDGPDADDILEPFSCPRCGSTVSERFWGPCAACRAELTAAQRSPAGDGEAAEAVTSGRFEPSMNVVPNHVATKD